eukprot:COSAG01_NODE_12846_length_1676_cov_1.496512_1_plen_366_part_00
MLKAVVLLGLLRLTPCTSPPPNPYNGTCELLDGDCPKPCPRGTEGSLSATPTIQISQQCRHAGLCRPHGGAFQQVATWSDGTIRAHSTHNGSDVVSCDDTHSGLHTSLLYTCCHTAGELLQLRRVLRSLAWSAFWVNYSDAGCNLDMHGSDIVYLHIMPDEAGQQRLLNLTLVINNAMAAAGVPVHHPRRSKFHMTLARVRRSYGAAAVGAAVRQIKTVVAGSGLQLLVCRFQALGEVFSAEGGCPAERCVKRSPSKESAQLTKTLRCARFDVHRQPWPLKTDDGGGLPPTSSGAAGKSTRYNCTTKGLGVRCLAAGQDGVYADSTCGGTNCALPPPPPRQWPPAPPPTTTTQAPNILFILSDDL